MSKPYCQNSYQKVYWPNLGQPDQAKSEVLNTSEVKIKIKTQIQHKGKIDLPPKYTQYKKCIFEKGLLSEKRLFLAQKEGPFSNMITTANFFAL